MARVSVIIVAAGEGKRFGSRKQFSFLRGKPILDWSLETFDNHEGVDEIILVLREEEQKEKILTHYRKVVAVVRGGEIRQDSVIRGFDQINPDRAEVILVHDGTRPLVKKDLISRVIEVTLEKGAAVPALSVKDTVKEVEGQVVLRTLEREKLYRVQTPQGFLYSILKSALDRVRENNYSGTDEASLVERTGKRIFIVEGDPKNIKITFPEDIKIAEAFLED